MTAYGPGVAPPEAPPTDTAPPASSSVSSDGALPLILASVVGLALGFLGAAAVLSRRHREVT